MRIAAGTPFGARYDLSMPQQGPMPPEGRMALSVLLGLFFAGFAAGSLHTASQEYRWRHATAVHGVLVKNGSEYHYEYRATGQPAVAGPSLTGESSDKPDGVIDDWIRLDYDPALPEHLRRRQTKGRSESNYRHFHFTASVGAVFSAAVLACVLAFFKALHDKRNPYPLSS
jgi:hypothetical protein